MIVTTVSLIQAAIHGFHGIKTMADESMDNNQENIYDLIALPGGMPGTTSLLKNSRILKIIESLNSDQKLITGR